MLFGGVIVSLLGVLGVTVGGVHFSVAQWAGLFAAVTAGCIPFCLIGLALGYVIVRRPARPGIVNLINLPARLRRRPVAALRDAAAVLQAIAPFVPQYHFGRLALGAVGLVADSDALRTSRRWPPSRSWGSSRPRSRSGAASTELYP